MDIKFISKLICILGCHAAIQPLCYRTWIVSSFLSFLSFPMDFDPLRFFSLMLFLLFLIEWLTNHRAKKTLKKREEKWI
jgi:hypothetical protein